MFIDEARTRVTIRTQLVIVQCNGRGRLWSLPSRAAYGSLAMRGKGT